MSSADELRTSLQNARSTYGGVFAGQPRVTRPLDRLEALIAEAERVAGEAEGELAAEAKSQVDAWSAEAKLIREAQAGGKDVAQASSLSQWARDSVERYRRNFAGQSRATRDIGMLSEIIDELEKRAIEMDGLLSRVNDPELATSRSSLQRNLESYRGELSKIKEVRLRGTVDERAGRLAGLANQQFQRYRMHFAGKARLGRNRRALESMIDALHGIRLEMVALKNAGVTNKEHLQNINIVSEHVKMYEAEREAIQQARNQSNRAQRIQALAEAANEVFSAYRGEFPGHARKTRNAAKLSELWEQLWLVALEMEAMAAEDPSHPVGANLQKVRDALRLYEREWHAILQAQAPESVN